MLNKKLLLTFLLGIFFISLVSAIPPVTTTQNFAEGYIVMDSPQTILRQGKDFNVNFFVYNASDGLLINNVSTECIYYLSDNYGSILFYSPVSYSSTGKYGHWSIKLLGNNFSNLGDYYYGIKCNSTNLGGPEVGQYTVTPMGKNGNELIIFSIFLIVFAYGLTLLGFFKENSIILIMGGMFMIFLSVYSITNGIIIYRDDITLYFSYLTFGLGVFFSLLGGNWLYNDL
jgi:hypothetical protein